MLWMLLTACTLDPGAPSYPERLPWEDTANASFEGFDPWEEGEPRLSLGVFYEGGASEVVPVDNVTQHYYVYSNTFSQSPSDVRIEGAQSDVITVGNAGWWGGGVHWDNPANLTTWSTLHLGLLATDSSFQDLEIGMVSVGDPEDDEVRLRTGDYGFVADGTWQEVELPLADLVAAGLDLTQVKVSLIMIGEGSPSGSQIWIYDVYISGENR